MNPGRRALSAGRLAHRKRAWRRYCSGPFKRGGQRQRHHLDALLAQRLGFVAAWPGRGCRARRPRRSGCGAPLRRSARRHPRCCAIIWRTARSHCACRSLGAGSASALARPRRRHARPRGSGAARSAGARSSVSPHSGQATRPRSRLRHEVVVRGEPAFEAVVVRAAQVRTFMAADYRRAAQVKAQACQSQRPSGRRANCCKPEQADQRLGVGELAAPRPARRARRRWRSTTSRNSPASRWRSPSVRPRANQISMPSLE